MNWLARARVGQAPLPSRRGAQAPRRWCWRPSSPRIPNGALHRPAPRPHPGSGRRSCARRKCRPKCWAHRSSRPRQRYRQGSAAQSSSCNYAVRYSAEVFALLRPIGLLSLCPYAPRSLRHFVLGGPQRFARLAPAKNAPSGKPLAVRSSSRNGRSYLTVYVWNRSRESGVYPRPLNPKLHAPPAPRTRMSASYLSPKPIQNGL